jgi:glutaminase
MAYNGEERIQNLLLGGYDVNAADYDGRTALHLAAAQNQIVVVKILLKFNADGNLLDFK